MEGCIRDARWRRGVAAKGLGSRWRRRATGDAGATGGATWGAGGYGGGRGEMADVGVSFGVARAGRPRNRVDEGAAASRVWGHPHARNLRHPAWRCCGLLVPRHFRSRETARHARLRMPCEPHVRVCTASRETPSIRCRILTAKRHLLRTASRRACFQGVIPYRPAVQCASSCTVRRSPRPEVAFAVLDEAVRDSGI